jgi:hypothetical protein
MLFLSEILPAAAASVAESSAWFLPDPPATSAAALWQL